jgi:hypothetical protein
MSRYQYHPRHWPAHYSFAVGWNPESQTFYAQVIDSTVSRDDDCIVIWVGGMPRHYLEVDRLMSAVNSRIKRERQHISLTPELKTQLMQDKEKHESAKMGKNRRKCPSCGSSLKSKKMEPIAEAIARAYG